MNNFEEIFFTLLKSALWGTPACLQCTISKEEWNSIYNISKEQTVSGIMLDAIAMLPQSQRPHSTLLIKWIVLQEAIKKSNIAMNMVLVGLIQDLNSKNIQAYVLKGQGLAQNYPHPTHRVCGDIDLYFKEKDFDRAVDFFSSAGCEIEGNPNETHYETLYKGIKLELHKKSTTFFTNRLQEKYNSTTAAILKEETDREFATIDGHSVEILPYTANVLQQLSHMLRHIITAGLGLRQVCDWVLYTNKYLNDSNKEQFLSNIKELELLQTYKVISAIATDYLGLPREKVACEINKSDKKLAKKVFTIIMNYGNFGHYGRHSQKATFRDYIRTFTWKFKNCIRLRKLAKSETRNYLLWKYHFIDD